MHLVNPSGTGASGLSVSAHQSCESLLDPVASPSPSPTASYHPLNDYRRPAGDSEGSAFPTPEFRPASPQTRRASDMIRHDHPYPTVNTALPGPPSPTSTIDQLPSFTATNTACSSPLPQSNYHPQSAMPSPNLIPGVAGFSQPPVYPYTTFPPQQGQNEHMKPAQLISSSIHTPYAGHDSRGLETQNMINKSRPAYAPLPIVGGEYLQNELQHSNPGGPTAKDPSPVSHRGGNKKTKTPTKHKVKGRHFMHGLPVVNRVERKTTTATTSATEGRGLSPTSLVDDLDGLSVAGATLENMTLNDDTSTHSFSTGTTAQDIDPDDASILSEASAKSLQSDNASVRSMSSTAVSADSDTDKKNGKKLKEKRLHACSMCNKRFTRQFNLRSHENTHKNIRPYPCEYCHWAFTRRNDISRHLRTKHRGFPPIITCLDERKSTGNNQWTKKKQSVSTEPSLSATSTAPVVTTQSITSAATATVAALATAASVTAIPSKQHWQTQILL
ncbi:hypothetical protein BGW41_000923 [Actinomortierella wolfii]|nr:hypothetical protein BGW41_000923 [Actinomortierella wolfii]